MKDDKVSSTAFSVAQGILLVSRNGKTASLVNPLEKSFYEKILLASESGRKKWKQVQSPVFRFFVPFLERLMIPGLTVHYVLRKKAIEDFTRSALAKGAKQVVNLGAGFDSLAWRLCPEFPKVRFIEVDHPATHKVKKEALQAIGDVSKNLHLLDVDFNKDSLEKKLGKSAHFKPNLSTVFIIEGVLMYLDEDKIVALFDSLKKITSKGFRLVFTFITPDGEGKYTHGPLLSLYLKIKNEPLNWKINATDLKKFMGKNKIPLYAVVKSEDIFKKLMPQTKNVIVHDGEWIACADLKEQVKNPKK